MKDPDYVLVSGDWHGNPYFARDTIKYAAKTGCSIVLQVGDFGFWTPGMDTESYLMDIENAATAAGVDVWWLDGNHEDHSRRHLFNDPVRRPHTKYLPRGHRWSWWGKGFMALGGAVSVDRHSRILGRSWWAEETLTDDEIAYASRGDGTTVDVIFAHDCPGGVDIPGVGPDNESRTYPAPWPPDLLVEADIHRSKVKKVWERLRPQVWIHGHYHIPYVRQMEGTQFIGLASDMEYFIERASCILNPDLSITMLAE